MLFESKNHRVFNGFPIDKYRYNIEVGESCFAVRLVFDDGDEYILSRHSTLEKATSKCETFKRKFRMYTNVVEVTRTSDTKYEYEIKNKDNCKHSGSDYGTFTQEPLAKIDEFTIRGRHLRHNPYEGREQPDEYTVGASYLAEECVKHNPIIDDEFTVGASYASSDFYEYQTGKRNRYKKNKDPS